VFNKPKFTQSHLINCDFTPTSIPVEDKLFTFTRAGASERLIHIPSPPTETPHRASQRSESRGKTTGLT
jgi:hypothetical protein